MDSGHYILEGREILHIPCDIIWANLSNQFDGQIAQTYAGPIRISTIFLGLDHNFGGGEPVLFETMVFGGEHDQDQDRCSTYGQAEVMHRRMVNRVWNSIPIIPRLFYWWTRWLWQAKRPFWRARIVIERIDDYMAHEPGSRRRAELQRSTRQMQRWVEERVSA